MLVADQIFESIGNIFRSNEGLVLCATEVRQRLFKGTPGTVIRLKLHTCCAPGRITVRLWSQHGVKLGFFRTHVEVAWPVGQYLDKLRALHKQDKFYLEIASIS